MLRFWMDSKDMEEDKFKELYDSLNLAMTFKDFLHIQNYYKGEEKRDPSMTEIRVLDTPIGQITVVIQHSPQNFKHWIPGWILSCTIRRSILFLHG